MPTMIRTLAKVGDAGQIWTPSCYNRRRVIDSAESRRLTRLAFFSATEISTLISFVFHLVGRKGIRRDNELFKSPSFPPRSRNSKKKERKERKKKEEDEKNTKKNRVVVCTRARIVLPAFFYLPGKLSNCGPLNPPGGGSRFARFASSHERINETASPPPPPPRIPASANSRSLRSLFTSK